VPSLSLNKLPGVRYGAAATAHVHNNDNPLLPLLHPTVKRDMALLLLMMGTGALCLPHHLADCRGAALLMGSLVQALKVCGLDVH
jgi:hypothetical protein